MLDGQGSPSYCCVLSELFLQQVARRPHETALKTPSEAITFAQLRFRALAIRQALLHSADASSDGVEDAAHHRPTTVVAIACGNSQIAEICAVLGVVLCGACFVPLDESLPAPRLREVLRDAHPAALIFTRASSPAQAAVSAVLETSRPQGCFVLELDGNGEPARTATSPAPGGTTGSRVQGAILPRSARTDRFGLDALGTVVVGDKRRRSLVDDVSGVSPLGLGSDHPSPGNRGVARDDAVAESQLGRDAAPRHEEDLLYIMYTSGTTGMPKGVRGTRSGAINRIRFGWTLCPFRDDDELVARRTLSCFVDFVAEIFSPLLAGVPLFLPPDGAAADPLLLVPSLAEARATRITVTPSLLASLLRTAGSAPNPVLPDLHTWLVSGEALHPDLALLFCRRTAPGTQLINLYGSTEVSGDATYCTLDEIIEAARDHDEPGQDSRTGFGGVMIGKPLPGVHLSIVGVDMHPVPVGEPGELLVGGVGVALGYHRRPQETTNRFLLSASHQAAQKEKGLVNLPGLEPGRRVVRTRDRVFQLVAGGPLFWIGKLDGEVKVRGVRVSLEEVDILACKAAGMPPGGFAVAYDPGGTATSISSSKGSSVGAAATNSPDRGRLIAFFVQTAPLDEQHSTYLAKLKRKLAAELTTAQLPAVLVPVVGGFPLTTTGKVDRRALLRECNRKGAAEVPPKLALLGASGVAPATRFQAEQQLDAVRESVAQAVIAVLPGAKAAVAEWLTNPAAEVATFTGLGGTSLLAVEAAWLASRGIERLPIGVQALSTLLTAGDFLRGTLEEATSTLHDRMQEEQRRSTKQEATALAQSSPHSSYCSCPLPLVPAGSAASSIDRASVEVPSAGSKRRLVRKAPASTPAWLAISRAGAGLVHGPICLGAMTVPARDDVGKVELRISRGSCLTKCIDATPLVVVTLGQEGPPETRTKRDAGTCGSIDDPSVETVSSPECLCAGLDSGAGAAAQDLGSKTLYIGSHSGDFQALDVATGERLWSFVAGDRVESGAACSSDGMTVFVGSHDHHFYALDRDTGVAVWSFQTGDAIKCTPVCIPPSMTCSYACGENAGAVLVGSHEGVLRCLCQASGALLWSFDCGGALFASPASNTSSPCVVYAATTKGRVLALGTGAANSAYGEGISSGSAQRHPVVVWEQMLPAPCFSTPAVCSDTGAVVLGCVDGGLYCLASTGEQLWVSREGLKPVFASPCLLPFPIRSSAWGKDLVGRPHVVWGCHDGNVRCRRGVGVAWATNVGLGQPVFSSPCFATVACEGCARPCPLVFVCTVPGLVAALRLSDGVIVGERHLPGEVFSSPVVAGRHLVVGCRDDNVYVLEIFARCFRCVKAVEP